MRSPHAFSTRRGGISAFEHTKALNLAFLRGDDSETVLKNLEIFARSVGFDAKKVYLCDMLENVIEEVPCENNEIKLNVSNFEIVTLLVK